MYKPGDWLVRCDRCGRRRYASECRFTWNELFVCADRCWEPRHPQDSVTAVPDDPSVPTARPDRPQTMGETTVGIAAAAGATSISLASVTGLSDGDSLGITMDNGLVHWTFSDGDPAVLVVTLGSYLPYAAALGNTVYLPSINSETFSTASGISGSDL